MKTQKHHIISGLSIYRVTLIAVATVCLLIFPFCGCDRDKPEDVPLVGTPMETVLPEAECSEGVSMNRIAGVMEVTVPENGGDVALILPHWPTRYPAEYREECLFDREKMRFSLTFYYYWGEIATTIGEKGREYHLLEELKTTIWGETLMEGGIGLRLHFDPFVKTAAYQDILVNVLEELPEDNTCSQLRGTRHFETLTLRIKR